MTGLGCTTCSEIGCEQAQTPSTVAIRVLGLTPRPHVQLFDSDENRWFPRIPGIPRIGMKRQIRVSLWGDGKHWGYAEAPAGDSIVFPAVPLGAEARKLEFEVDLRTEMKK